ncbi:MAG: hypothetical protein IJ807_06665 [Eubacterium sp.]|nr:hypothetical protein [Eubacterium sp.]
MACFIVPAAEAVVVKVCEKVVASKEAETNEAVEHEVSIPLKRKLKWLNYMLIGGAVLLLFEHIWHGEIVAWFPFLSAMASPSDMNEMFLEMATVGTSMAAFITLIWGGMCLVAERIVKRSSRTKEEKA